MCRRQGVNADFVGGAIDRLSNQNISRVIFLSQPTILRDRVLWTQQWFKRCNGVAIYSQDISTRMKWWSNPVR